MKPGTGNHDLTALVAAAMAVAAAMVLAGPFAERAAAHGGGKDRFGGHVGTATGGYHCHGAEGTPRREACALRATVEIQERKLVAALAAKAGLEQRLAALEASGRRLACPGGGRGTGGP